MYAFSRRGALAGGASALLVTALLVAAAPEALAHGGTYRGPGGSVPPPSGTPTPTAVTPGETWQTWWDLNRFGVIPTREEALRRQVTTPDDSGPADPLAIEAEWSLRRVEAARTLLPVLLGLVDPRGRSRDEVKGAALIALAKIGQNRVHVPLLRHYLRDPASSALVRESAAFGIGLLRRSRPERQLDGALLDRLRQELLDVFDDANAPDQVRVFAVLAVGLLGDQPFGSEETRDGRAVSLGLWQRLEPTYAAADLPAALFAALALQPRAGVRPEVLAGLEAMVAGREVHGRFWNSRERSHALTTALRLGVPDGHAILFRILSRTREEIELRRAACLALGRFAEEMVRADRVLAARVLVKAIEKSDDDFFKGLAYLALGRLAGVDLREGRLDVLEADSAAKRLRVAAERAPFLTRGFAVLGLAFAARGARESDVGRAVVLDARRLVMAGLCADADDDTVRASYAVAAGLLGIEEAIAPMCAIVRDKEATAVLRGHAAVSLGQIGRRADVVRESLLGLLVEEHAVLTRVQAAVGLSLLGAGVVQPRLLEELRTARTEYARSHVVLALGYLGDLSSLPALVAHASDEKATDLSRALGVAALGILTDPEPRPSVFRLTQDANYPAGTNSLFAAFAIF